MKAQRKSLPRRKSAAMSKTLKCVACSFHRDAEVVHPDLRVPICGACHLLCKQRDMKIRDSNEESCIMCGTGDDNELMMCDSCPKSFCTACIERNFGPNELRIVREAAIWECYICAVGSLFSKLQVDEGTVFHSLDTAYAAVKPPPQLPSVQELIMSLSPGESLFASIFSNEVSSSIFSDLGIVEYLAAPDIMPKLFSLSKKLRLFFRLRNIVLPGLFRTNFGVENLCRLHPHQVVSLNKLTEIENRKQSFASLRGGVFADEPGLGKTVTALALIASSAGQLPTCPSLFWDNDKINESWGLLTSQHETLLAPIFNKLRKLNLLNFNRDPVGFEVIKSNLRKGTYTLAGVVSAVKQLIKISAISPSARDHCMSVFRYEMNSLKERLDSSRRKSLSMSNSRALYERRLLPSPATLIIVPLALLEHWYEQIMRHLELSYFLHPEDRLSMRGVVYLDGLGDIMDVEAPLSKVFLRPSVPIQPADFLSNYLIVVTTLERCAWEHRLLDKANQDQELYAKPTNHIPKRDAYDEVVVSCEGTQTGSMAAKSPLMQLRWLRLIVDEGHEIGRLSNDPGVTKAFAQAGDMIAQIAAERRWIMSGTPTTGAHSDVGLYQLYQILSFLRHPLYTGMDGTRMTYLNWKKDIVEPCLFQDVDAWERVKSILLEIMVRHTKQDIHLFSPIYTTVNLEGITDASDPIEEARMLRVDRAKASHIAQTILHDLETYKALSAKSVHRNSSSRRSLSMASGGRLSSSTLDEEDLQQQELLFKARRPKAIVFSQHHSDLQGVGHFLYLMMGENHVCEHFGAYQSAELSRFRHSKRKFRVCPMCGHRNLITSACECEKTLLLVEYVDVPLHPQQQHQQQQLPAALAAHPQFVQVETDMRPYPAGHGHNGLGGHYLGRCLCSVVGCDRPCKGIPNPFHTLREAPHLPVSPHLALIAEEHILNYVPGVLPQIGAQVFVSSSAGVANVADIHTIEDAPTPKLWYGGRRGGRAIVRQWRKCGGRNLLHSWHGNGLLPQVPWTVIDEEASILLLQQEGSTGLDLSFATRIFLLERITDPALKNQLVSRAHRVGATGPVSVTLLQVLAEKDETAD